MSSNNKIRVLIVEDELIIGEDLRMMLIELGYDPLEIATSYYEALEIIENEKVQIALVDIMISGDKDGIELAKVLKSKFDLPIIFLTSLADKATVERAKTIQPEGYLVKPFNAKDLFTAIEIAFFKSVNKAESKLVYDQTPSKHSQKDSIFVKVDDKQIKININHLQWIKAEGNYIELHITGNKKFLARYTLKEIITKLPARNFIQVHKSYIVNTESITAIQYNKLYIDKIEIPVSRSYLNDIKHKLNLE